MCAAIASIRPFTTTSAATSRSTVRRRTRSFRATITQGICSDLADSYTQGSAQRENVRTTGFYVFAQDSWKINPSLTLNYGLRWELDTPLTDVSASRPDLPSRTELDRLSVPAHDRRANDFRGEHLRGCRCRTDRPGCSRRSREFQAGLTQTYYKAFAPRIGIAYSPNFTSGTWESSSDRTARPAFAPDGACSTTRWSSWCSSSSALNRRSEAALFCPRPSSILRSSRRAGQSIPIRSTAF